MGLLGDTREGAGTRPQHRGTPLHPLPWGRCIPTAPRPPLPVRGRGGDIGSLPIPATRKRGSNGVALGVEGKRVWKGDARLTDCENWGLTDCCLAFIIGAIRDASVRGVLAACMPDDFAPRSVHSSLDKILAVRAPVEGRPGVPTRRAGARCHSIERLFVESGRRESVAEPEEKSASTLPASGLPPGRRPYPTLMDRLSATKLSKLERFSMPNKMLARLRRRKMFLLLGLGAGVAALGA